MKSEDLIPRLAVLFLAVSLALPAPSLAFRSEAAQEASGLEEVQTALRRVASPIGLAPTPSPLPSRLAIASPATAGLEEWNEERLRAYQRTIRENQHEVGNIIVDLNASVTLITREMRVPALDDSRNNLGYAHNVLRAFLLHLYDLPGRIDGFGPGLSVHISSLGAEIDGLVAGLELALGSFVEAGIKFTEVLEPHSPKDAQEIRFLVRFIDRRMQSFIKWHGQIDTRGSPSPTNLNESIQTVLAYFMRRGFPGSDWLAGNFSFEESLPLVSIDPDLAFQIWNNLVRNVIEAADQPATPFSIATRKEENWVRVDVVDKGTGILLEDLSRIFELGFTTKEEKKGHGIGLALVKEIVEKVGGTIEVASHHVSQSDDHGTTFTIRFPVAAGLEERTIRDFAETWKLVDLSELHLVGVTPEAIKANPFLEILRRRPVSIGDATLVMIPKRESEMVDLLVSFMSEPREISVVGYQGLGGDGEGVEAFLQTAKRLGLNPMRLGDLETQAFRVFFRQLIHNISGIPLEAIQANDLVDFERALRRLRSA